MDAEQPMLEGLPQLRKFKSYVGLSGAEKKFRCWLTEFDFVDVAVAAAMVDWKSLSEVKLE